MRATLLSLALPSPSAAPAVDPASLDPHCGDPGDIGVAMDAAFARKDDVARKGPGAVAGGSP